jgi:hypothetical protein
MGSTKPVYLILGLFIIAGLLVTGCNATPAVTTLPQGATTYSGWPELTNGDKGFVHSDGIISGAGVQVLPYIAGNNLVMQILNYNSVNDTFTTQKNVAVNVRLPDGLTAMNKTLQLFSPDGNKEITLEYTVDQDWLKFTVPELNTWLVAVLQ